MGILYTNNRVTLLLWILSFFIVSLHARSITLTEEETEWLEAHPVLRVSNIDSWPPFNFVEHGKPRGFSIDYMNLLAEKAGFTPKYIQADWVTHLNSLGKDIDIILDIYHTPKRAETIGFTDPYSVNNIALFVNENTRDIQSFEDLKGRHVAIILGYAANSYIREKYPSIQIRNYNTIADALQAVSNGDVDAFIEEYSVVNNIINSESIQGVKEVAFEKLTNQERQYLYMGVPVADTLLVSILNKAMQSVTRQEMVSLRRKWFYSKAEKRIELSDEERQWINNHPPIEVSNEYDWAPFNFVENDKPLGFSIDVMNLISRKTGLEVVFKQGDWKTHINSIKGKKLDVILNVTYTKDRAEYIDFSQPYITNNAAIFVKNDRNDIASIDDFMGKTLAVIDEFYITEVLNKRYPAIKLKVYPSVLEGMKAVVVGDADGIFAEHAAVNYVIVNEYIVGLKEVIVNEELDPKLDNTMRMGVPKGNTILLGILNKSLNAISDREWSNIRSTWGQKEGDIKPLFSNAEKMWLKEHKTMRLGVDPQWPPFEFVDYGNVYKGIASDYIHILNKRLHINMQPLSIPTWNSVVEMAKNKEVDVLPAVVRTPEREKYLNFTEPYISYPMVIVTHTDQYHIVDIESIKGKIGIVKGYYSEEILHRDFPEKEVVLFTNIDEALIALKKGKYDAYIGNLASVTYAMRKGRLKKLKIVGHTPYLFDLSIGIRKDWPELVTIFNKTLAKMTPEEKVQIHSPWINTKVEHNVDYRLTWRILIIIVFVVAFTVIPILISWNRRLSLEVLRRKEAEVKAESANKAKSLFLANMSHEIRTPMNSIVGFTDILSDLIKDPNYSYYIDAIRTSAGSLLSLINDILDLSKVEAGKLELEKSPAALETLFKEMKTIFGTKAQEKGVRFSVSITEEVPQALYLDITRLRQILLNLTSNALKFTDKGMVSIAARSVNLSEIDSVELIITVEDTGIGIKKDQFENIFGAFNQARGQKYTKYGGTGLGLAISQRLATLMNGEIQVSSEYGKGTLFTLTIKNIKVAAPNLLIDKEKVLIEPGSVSFQGSKILIVDDMSLNRKLLHLFLENENLVLFEAEDGIEAIDQVIKMKPDLILMDMQMPKMNGYECSKVLKNSDDTASIPIIAITASVMKEDERMARQNCEDSLPKPVNRSELYTKLVKYLPHT